MVVRPHVPILGVAIVFMIFMPIPALAQDRAPTRDGETLLLELDLDAGIEYPFDTDFDLLDLGPVAGLTGGVLFPGLAWLRPISSISYSYLPVKAETSLSLISAGIGAGLRFEPTERLQIEVSLVAGVYYGFFNDELLDPDGVAYENQQGAGAAACLSAGVDFYLTPAIKIGVAAGYTNYIGLADGLRATVSASLDLDGLTRKVKLEAIEFERLFPSLYKHYDSNASGASTITNYERFPITDITVSVFSREYMDDPKSSAKIERLEPGESADVDLYVLFNSRILDLEESEKLTAEISLDYTLNGAEQRSVGYQTLDVQNRNAVTWTDDRKAAAFVSPKDDNVLRFAKQVAGLVRARGPAAVDSNLRMGMGMFETLGGYRMSYVIDPNTLPYEDAAKNTQVVDFLQFPAQTLYYKGGDCDDLSILYCSLLEAIGIETAFVTVPGHIFSAFLIDMDIEEAKNSFTSIDFISEGGRTWVPVETTMVDADFLSATEDGARQWREFSRTGAARLLPMHESWLDFESAGSPFFKFQPDLPDPDKSEVRYNASLDEFVDRELFSRVEEYRRKIASTTSPAKYLNRLGVLYARYGEVLEAEIEFKRSFAQEDYVPGMVNLANLYYIDGRNDEALELLERADALQPGDAVIKLSLARIFYETGGLAKVGSLYAQAKDIDAGKAEKYSYLAQVTQADGESRAAASDRAKSLPLWLDEEGE